jgi:hypothetical protein
MEDSIEAACKILERTTNEDKFRYIESTHYYRGGGMYDWFDDFDYGYGLQEQETYYLFEYVDEKGNSQWYETMAFSEAEAVGKLCMGNPRVRYVDIIDICHDSNYNN